MGTLKFAPNSGATARTLTMRSAPASPASAPRAAAPPATIIESGPKPIAREWLTMNQPAAHRSNGESANGSRMEARRGEIFVNPGRGGEAIYQIGRGHVALYKALPGRRSICVGLLGPGDVFTQEQGVGRTGITAEALTDVSYAAFSMDQLVAMLGSSPDAARGVLTSLTRRISETQILIERLLARDITLRLGGMLLDLGERFGKPAADGMIAIDIPVPHKMLARMIGGNRVTVTRVMTDLRADGLVASPGRNRVVIAPDKLRAHVDHLEA